MKAASFPNVIILPVPVSVVLIAYAILKLFAYWLIFHVLSSADFFKNLFFSKKYLKNTIVVSNSFDSDHVQIFVGPDLRPNCLQKF